jgi:hypothetical protein
MDLRIASLDEVQERLDELQKVNENLGMENEMLADFIQVLCLLYVLCLFFTILEAKHSCRSTC